MSEHFAIGTTEQQCNSATAALVQVFTENRRLREALKRAEEFIADEVRTCESSFLPTPTDRESEYLSEARDTLALVREVLRGSAG